VLVDSESITNGVLRDMLEALGWTLTREECMRVFVGKAVKDEAATIEAKTGRPIDDAWLAEFRQRRNDALMASLLPIRNAVETVARLHEVFEGRIAVASGADRTKMELQLVKCGLMRYFEGRAFSGHDLPRSKPFPDVYLAAAAAVGADPARCAVVEDTVTGTRAGVAAGATVFGYSPPEAGHDAPQALRDAGASVIFTDLSQLPALLA
jgi:HAD superfamily hydrolase (TIGR01509 family)